MKLSIKISVTYLSNLLQGSYTLHTYVFIQITNDFCIAFREVWLLEKHEVLAIVTGVCGLLEWSFYIAIVAVQVI